LGIFGHKKIQVNLTYDTITKCQCVVCPVQANSACVKPKIAARNDMINNPQTMLNRIMTPGMMKNLEMIRNMGDIRSTTLEQRKQMSDEMMKNTSKEETDQMMPKPDDMPGPYCANGVAACKDLDYSKMCLCSSCAVFRDFSLGKGKPASYYCRDGKPI
jgi:hypothetical protein